MAELSVIIPARNEIFLQKTIENILENTKPIRKLSLSVMVIGLIRPFVTTKG